MSFSFVTQSSGHAIFELTFDSFLKPGNCGYWISYNKCYLHNCLSLVMYVTRVNSHFAHSFSCTRHALSWKWHHLISSPKFWSLYLWINFVIYQEKFDNNNCDEVPWKMEVVTYFHQTRASINHGHVFASVVIFIFVFENIVIRYYFPTSLLFYVSSIFTPYRYIIFVLVISFSLPFRPSVWYYT